MSGTVEPCRGCGEPTPRVPKGWVCAQCLYREQNPPLTRDEMLANIAEEHGEDAAAVVARAMDADNLGKPRGPRQRFAAYGKRGPLGKAGVSVRGGAHHSKGIG